MKAETVAREKVPLKAPKLRPQAKLSLGARLALAVKGSAKIGEYIDPQNNSLVRLYVGKCSTHGIYLDRVHAGTFEIRCPKCDNAFLLERNYLIWQEANV